MLVETNLNNKSISPMTMKCDVCFRPMESRRADPLYLLVLTVIVFVGTAKAINTPEQSGDHETTTKTGAVFG